MEKEKDRGCGVCATPHFERNNYFYSKLMTVRDFFAEQRYFNEKRWLMNRMISGHGVVCGLAVKYDRDRQALIVSPGLALDCCGHEILVCEEQALKLEEVEKRCNPQLAGELSYVLCLEYHECKTEPVQISSIACGGEERHEFNRLRDSFKLRLRYAEDVNLDDPHCRLCPLAYNKRPAPDRLVHEYLCCELRKGCPECEDKCCLVLAQVISRETPNGLVVDIDQCTHRKLVYNNQLLYDLIDCYHGDLPHIVDISWMGIHGKDEVGIEKMYEVIGYDPTCRPADAVAHLVVKFDCDIDPTTINKHSFQFYVFVRDDRTGMHKKEYIPAKKIEYDVAQRKAIFHIHAGWIRDELYYDPTATEEEDKKSFSPLLEHGATFEVVLRGSLILDKNRKALDGEFIAGQFPTGNGVQGGDFVSYFSVSKL